MVAVYFGARAAMGFGRDVRAAVFHRVGSFSSREVARFGAPSLITRNTNDVQQVQMLVLLSCTLMATAPIMMVGGVIMALREDVGLSWLLVVSVPALLISVGVVISRMLPSYRVMQVRIDAVNKTLREQITGIRVVRAFVREPFEARRFEAANRELTNVALRVGRWMAVMLAISEFPKWRKYLILLSFLDNSSARPVQIGGVDVNICHSRSTAVRGRRRSSSQSPPRGPFCRTRTGPVEADGAVDAQNAPTAPWKTLCVFHELPQGLSHQVTHEKLRKAPKYRWEIRIDP